MEQPGIAMDYFNYIARLNSDWSNSEQLAEDLYLPEYYLLVSH
jgi:hypothetical protein